MVGRLVGNTSKIVIQIVLEHYNITMVRVSETTRVKIKKLTASHSEAVILCISNKCRDTLPRYLCRYSPSPSSVVVMKRYLVPRH